MTTHSVSRPRESAGVSIETEMRCRGRGPGKSRTVHYLVSTNCGGDLKVNRNDYELEISL